MNDKPMNDVTEIFKNKDRFIRVAEASEMTGLSKPTLYRLAKNGGMPPLIKLSERTRVWKESELKAWLAGIEAAPLDGQKETSSED